MRGSIFQVKQQSGVLMSAFPMAHTIVNQHNNYREE